MKSQRGAVLVTVLILSLILFLVIGGFLFLISSEWAMLKRYCNYIRAFYIAEAGIDKMYVYLKGMIRLSESARVTYWGNPEDGQACSISINNEDFGGGTYSVTAQTTRDAEQEITITSTGTYAGATSAIEIECDKGPKNPFEYLLAGGNIYLHGRRFIFWPIYVIIEPDSHVVANSTITTNYVIFRGGSSQTSNADIPLPQFLETVWVDTDADGTVDTTRYVDLNGRAPSANPNPDIPVDDNYSQMCNQLYDVNGDGDPENAAHPNYAADPHKHRRDMDDNGKIEKADEIDPTVYNDNPFPNINDPAVTLDTIDFNYQFYDEDEDEIWDDLNENGVPDIEDTHWHQWNTEFDEDDMDSDEKITERDGFIYYYTETLGKGENNLGETGSPVDYDIAVEEATEDGLGNYYSGDQYFGGFSGTYIDPDQEIIFVDGDVTILFNATEWWGSGERDLTVVSTGDVDIYLPINQANDRLNIIAYGNVYCDTTILSGEDGFHTNIYSHGHENLPSCVAVNIDWSGLIDGCIVCNKKIDIGDLFLVNRRLKYNDRILSDLPAGFGFGDHLTEGSHPLYPRVPAKLKVGKKISGSWRRI